MKFIELEKIGINESIAVLTINRPAVLNAINIDVIAELSIYIRCRRVDDRTKVVIITGAEKIFLCRSRFKLCSE